MMSMLRFLFHNYPPAVTSVFSSTVFGGYLLVLALYFQFNPAPDHSMPKDYNRLLHNLSNYELCTTPSLNTTNTTNYKNVSLLTSVHGSTVFVHANTRFTALIDTPEDGTYFVRTDSRWKNPACEKGKCKVQKCVQVFAPAQYFPNYDLSSAKQCVPEIIEDSENINVNICPTSNKTLSYNHTLNKTLSDFKFDFKRNNLYAQSLPEPRKLQMQLRLTYLGLGVLVFVGCVVMVGVWNARYYHGVTFWGPLQTDSL